MSLNNIDEFDEINKNIDKLKSQITTDLQELQTSIETLDNKYDNEVRLLEDKLDTKQDIINIQTPFSYLFSDIDGKIAASEKLKEGNDTLMITSKINNISIPETDGDNEFILDKKEQIVRNKIHTTGTILTNNILANVLPENYIETLSSLVKNVTDAYEGFNSIINLSLGNNIFFVFDIDNAFLMGCNIFKNKIISSDVFMSPNNISCGYFSPECNKILMSEPITKRIIEAGATIDMNGNITSNDYKSNLFDGLIKFLISDNDKSIKQCNDILYNKETKKIEGTYADLSMKKIYSIENYNCMSFLGGRLLMSSPTKDIIEVPPFPWNNPLEPLPDPLLNPLDYAIYELWLSMRGPQGLMGPQGIPGEKGDKGDSGNNTLGWIGLGAAGGAVFGGLLTNAFNWLPELGAQPEIHNLKMDPDTGDIFTKGEMSIGNKFGQYGSDGAVKFTVENGDMWGRSLIATAGISASTIGASQFIQAPTIASTTMTTSTLQASSNIQAPTVEGTTIKAQSIEMKYNDFKIADVNDTIVFQEKPGQISNKSIDNSIIGQNIPNQGYFTKIVTDTIEPIIKTDQNGQDLNINGGEATSTNPNNTYQHGNINMGQQNTTQINFYAPAYFYNNIQMNVKTIIANTQLDNTYSTIIADTTNNDIVLTLPAITQVYGGYTFFITKKSQNNKLIINCFDLNERIFGAVNSIELTENGDNIRVSSNPINLTWN